MSTIETNTENDTETLHKAMKGSGKNKEEIIKLVANRTVRQRMSIKEYYKIAYGGDILEDLEKALSGNFSNAVVALFTNPIQYDCIQLRKAMKGAGSDKESLIELIVTRPNWMIKSIVQEYSYSIKRDLIKDVESETSGPLQKILLAFLQGNKGENLQPNLEECTQLAQSLINAEPKNWWIENSVLIPILTTKSPIEIALICREYHKLAKKTILESIEKEVQKKDGKKYLRLILFALISPSEYFAKRLNQAVKGIGTDDNLLIRILVTRDEIDMPQIKQYYKQIIKKDMLEDIKGDTSGDYRNLLIELADH